MSHSGPRARRLRCAAFAALAALAAPSLALAGTVQFTPGNLVVLRVGTGAAPLSSSATAAFLDEYTTAGVHVQSVALPTAGAGSNLPLTLTGSSTADGFITRSADRRYLIVPGYGAVPGTATVAST